MKIQQFTSIAMSDPSPPISAMANLPLNLVKGVFFATHLPDTRNECPSAVLDILLHF